MYKSAIYTSAPVEDRVVADKSFVLLQFPREMNLVVLSAAAPHALAVPDPLVTVCSIDGQVHRLVSIKLPWIGFSFRAYLLNTPLMP
jgi:hypothetical protein